LKEELLPGLRFDIPDFVPAVFGEVPQFDELAEEAFDKCQNWKTPLYKQGFGWMKWPQAQRRNFWCSGFKTSQSFLWCGSTTAARILQLAGRYTNGRLSDSMDSNQTKDGYQYYGTPWTEQV